MFPVYRRVHKTDIERTSGNLLASSHSHLCNCFWTDSQQILLYVIMDSRKRSNRSWDLPNHAAGIKRFLDDLSQGDWRDFVLEKFKPYSLLKSHPSEVLFAAGAVLELSVLLGLLKTLEEDGQDLVFTVHGKEGNLRVTAVSADSKYPTESKKQTEQFKGMIKPLPPNQSQMFGYGQQQQFKGSAVPLIPLSTEQLDTDMASSFGFIKGREEAFKRELGDNRHAYKYEMGEAILLGEVGALEKKTAKTQPRPFKVELQVIDNKMVLFVTGK